MTVSRVLTGWGGRIQSFSGNAVIGWARAGLRYPRGLNSGKTAAQTLLSILLRRREVDYTCRRPHSSFHTAAGQGGRGTGRRLRIDCRRMVRSRCQPCTTQASLGFPPGRLSN